MGEELKEWTHMWGAKVKLRNDMTDDMLKDAIETTRRLLGEISDFDTEGRSSVFANHCLNVIILLHLFI